MRKIIHIDMDCFYAAIEVRDNPSLQGKPVAVGGLPERRGVLTTCNYEARHFGLHSAMPSVLALKRCPQLILLPVNMQKYQSVSQEIHQIFRTVTDNIEPLSLDEAYLDVTAATCFQGSATWIAQHLRESIFQQLHLTASAGIAPNKFLAKIASNINKPNGQFVILPKHIDGFILKLPVEKIMGVGNVTAKKLHAMNIKNCGDLQKLDYSFLSDQFGKFGEKLYQYSRGRDDRPVQSNLEKKCVSVETTFVDNLTQLSDCLKQITLLFVKLEERINKIKQPVIKQYVKIKFFDFTQTTVECSSLELSQEIFFKLIEEGIQRKNKSVRLLGIGVKFGENQKQLSLLE